MVEKVKKERKKSANYFPNDEMLALIDSRNEFRKHEVLSKEEQRTLRKIEERIGVLYFKISEGLMRRPNFCNYDLATKADMISDAVFNCLKAGETYNTKFKNPHAYFTQISWNAFILNIKAMKKRSNFMLPLGHVENLETYNDENISE